ncbi:MAG: hypothetical protein L3J36_04160 [Rhodobacteraceae bacterium]|nr:hypothetical protein [Paracoccaceae bacterium]
MEEPLTQTVLNISPQVFQMLGIYVRELSRENPPPNGPVMDLSWTCHGFVPPSVTNPLKWVRKQTTWVMTQSR